MIILILCDGCGNRFANLAACEAHRPAGTCASPAAAGLAERTHRDRSRHGQGRITYWAAVSGATA